MKAVNVVLVVLFALLLINPASALEKEWTSELGPGQFMIDDQGTVFYPDSIFVRVDTRGASSFNGCWGYTHAEVDNDQYFDEFISTQGINWINTTSTTLGDEQQNYSFQIIHEYHDGGSGLGSIKFETTFYYDD
jgi:hypothetical protein